MTRDERIQDVGRNVDWLARRMARCTQVREARELLARLRVEKRTLKKLEVHPA